MYDEFHQLFSGNEYAINSKHSIGLQFSGVWTKRIKNLTSQTEVQKTGEEIEPWVLHNRTESRSGLYNVNASYLFKPDSLQQLSLIAGFAYQGKDSYGEIRECQTRDSLYLPSSVQSSAEYLVYSVQADYDFNLFRFAGMRVGLKYSQIDNNGNSSQTDLLSNSYLYSMKNRMIDRIGAAYFNLSKQISFFTFQAGLRYEYTYSDILSEEQSFQRSLHSLYPSFSMDARKGGFNAGLSYTRRIFRPPFEALDPEIRYTDSYSYSQGNPELRPAFINSVDLYSSWKNFHLMLTYGYLRDFFTQVAVMDADNPDIMVFTFVNIPEAHRLFAGIVYANTWKWYTARYEAYFAKEFSKIPFLSEEISRNQPMFQIKVSNSFHIWRGLNLDCDFQYRSGYDTYAIHFEPIYNLSAGLSWKFLNNKLTVSVMADNILGLANMSCFNTLYENCYEDSYADEDSRYIRIGIRYDFSNLRSGIRRKESNSEEIGRL